MQTSSLMTAIVTPFDANDQLDLTMMGQLIDHLLATGTDGLVIGGTTGESPTLTHAEKLRMYRFVVDYVAGRVPIIANTGTNNTRESVQFTQEVSHIAGIDAVLAVTPYYNKPDQAGMIAHFEAIANAGGLPVMLYNIPGRSAVGLTNASVQHLAQHPNIIAVKQVTTAEDLAWLVANTPADFLVYSGEDALALAAKQVGAAGLISVTSHVAGTAFRDMYAAFDAGDHVRAAQIEKTLAPKIKAVFTWPSPAPVKAALQQRGLAVGQPRLPILPLTAADTAKLMQILGTETL